MSRFERWKVRHRFKGCLINVTRLVFTLLLLVLAIGYAFSIIVLDINIVLILVLIVLIWFTPTIARYFENIQFKREGDKLEFSLAFAKLRDIEEKAEEANLLQTPQNLSDVERFVQISKINPNAALIALRTDIERKLQQIVQAAQIDTSTIRIQSMGELLRVLERERILNREEVVVLHELRNTLNQVAHAVDVSPDVIHWAVNTGPFILTALDKKLTDIQSKK
ncbi:MAG: hypothetical protein ABI690_13180 [Chloroflexota bacterium]